MQHIVHQHFLSRSKSDVDLRIRFRARIVKIKKLYDGDMQIKSPNSMRKPKLHEVTLDVFGEQSGAGHMRVPEPQARRKAL